MQVIKSIQKVKQVASIKSASSCKYRTTSIKQRKKEKQKIISVVWYGQRKKVRKTGDP